jgi:hypothetical protein
VVWEIINFKPFMTGHMELTSSSGYMIKPAVYPHQSKEQGLKLRTRNELYYDGHVDTVTP